MTYWSFAPFVGPELELLEGQESSGVVWQVLFVGGEEDKGANILFELGEVANDVVLGEAETLLEAVLACRVEHKVTALKHLDHHLHLLLNLLEHLFRLLGLRLAIHKSNLGSRYSP